MNHFKCLTFKPSGKYYTEGTFRYEGSVSELTRAKICEAYYGYCPGLSTEGKEFILVVIPIGDHSYPRLFHPDTV